MVELENSIKALAAYYIASKKINHLELKSFLNQKLPNYAIPEFFIPIDFFPLTVNGKVDNIKLPKITIKPYNNRSDTIARSFEELIRASWYQTLNIRDFNSNDNFFNLGGNSIKAVVLAKNLNSNIKGKKTVSVVDIFRFPIFKQQVDNLARNIMEGEEC
ncbi:MAG: phosphopantetheine-binding protein [Wolbachia pipientis]|nr:phosphopantetheine-binding protein [Wolbachia pipientis]